MTDYILTFDNAHKTFNDIKTELNDKNVVLIKTSNANTGKWGMARLWRAWMKPTAEYMIKSGVTMPLYFKNGKAYGEREFNENDAHEAFTANWMGVDANGCRLSWSKYGRGEMRQATKGERFICMLRHEEWAINKGIILVIPRESEFFKEKEIGNY